MERTGERVKHERSNPSSLSGSTYSSAERTEGDEEGAVHMPSFFEWSEGTEGARRERETDEGTIKKTSYP